MQTNIYVTGSPLKKVSSEELIDFSNFCIGLLLPKNKSKRILEIEILGSSEDLPEDTLAECSPEGEPDSKGRIYEFSIQLRPGYGRRKTLSSLAHELVHVKQYATGELTDSPRGIRYSVWQGKHYDDSKIHYYDYPWEIDAYGREGGLLRRYLTSINEKL